MAGLWRLNPRPELGAKAERRAPIVLILKAKPHHVGRYGDLGRARSAEAASDVSTWRAPAGAGSWPSIPQSRMAPLRGREVTDAKTRAAHPQSDGRLERLRRTRREDSPSEEELADLHQALEVQTRSSDYCNTERPRSSLKHLRPVDHYRGGAEACLVEQERTLALAAGVR